MKEGTLKLKKGGLDTIIAYIVVMLPLLYVLIYMVATIYHFSVQMYMNQVVKEAAIMASTYGAVTQQHEKYIHDKLKGVLGAEAENTDNAKCTIKYYKREFNEDSGTPGDISSALPLSNLNLKKADIFGIYVESTEESMLGRVTAFNIFGGNSTDTGLKYSSYREEIIRNERKYDPQ